MALVMVTATVPFDEMVPTAVAVSTCWVPPEVNAVRTALKPSRVAVKNIAMVRSVEIELQIAREEFRNIGVRWRARLVERAEPKNRGRIRGGGVIRDDETGERSAP